MLKMQEVTKTYTGAQKPLDAVDRVTLESSARRR